MKANNVTQIIIDSMVTENGTIRVVFVRESGKKDQRNVYRNVTCSSARRVSDLFNNWKGAKFVTAYQGSIMMSIYNF